MLSKGARRWLAVRVLTLLLVAAILEGIAFVAFTSTLLRDKEFIWRDLDALAAPPSQALLDSTRATFWDRDVGWVRRPSTHRDLGDWRMSTDERGARREPLDVPGGLVSAYGDSFTFGEEVNNNQTWPHYLSAALKTRVDNWGETAYGPDQAVLRLRRNLPAQRTAVVVLAIMSEDIDRIVNCYRPFLTRNSAMALGFKPMVVDDGKPRWLPNPLQRSETQADFREALRVSREYDYWYLLNRERVRPHFPYLLQLLRATAYALKHADAENLYENREALARLDFLVDEFQALARAHDFTPVLLFIPGPADLQRFEQSRSMRYHRYLAEMRQRTRGTRLVTLDLVERHFQPVRFYRRPFKGHPSPYGQRVIAALLAEAIRPLLSAVR